MCFIVLEKLLPPSQLEIFLVFCLFAGQALATTYSAMSLEDMLSSAEVAFHGITSDIRVEARANEPWTIVTFEVKQSLLGDIGESIDLAFYGGTLDGVVLKVTSIPEFTLGEEVIILAYISNYYSPIVGFSQGLWRFGSRGFEDSERQPLGVNEEGKLVVGESAGTEEILTAFTEALQGGAQ